MLIILMIMILIDTINGVGQVPLYYHILDGMMVLMNQIMLDFIIVF